MPTLIKPAQQFRDLDRYVLGKNRFWFWLWTLDLSLARVAVAEPRHSRCGDAQ